MVKTIFYLRELLYTSDLYQSINFLTDTGNDRKLSRQKMTSVTLETRTVVTTIVQHRSSSLFNPVFRIGCKEKLYLEMIEGPNARLKWVQYHIKLNQLQCYRMRKKYKNFVNDVKTYFLPVHSKPKKCFFSCKSKTTNYRKGSLYVSVHP